MMTPERLRALAGVDRLPLFTDVDALNRSLQRHHPADLRAAGVGGSVLADVAIDEHGEVQAVTIVPRPSTAHVTMVMVEEDGTTRSVQPADNPAFGPAAEAALMETRFTPAMRDGQPVPFTLRMTVTFDPPAPG
ncbi:hypothetical protein [Longimicrobium sp.]|uniref:hypothetical protein n=1 Tax=Longimicrobium sp. TaxID=2029185 RepID=UPI002E372AD8|nr:hypothetical protein [Longimicrobium sp.]HEX6042331.1 hypothetical protein [Longimicrobium sp.]